MSTVMVELIWPEERGAFKDNLYGTGTIWAGNGDVQPIDAGLWKNKFSIHADVFRLAESQDGADRGELDGLSDEQVHALAKERGLRIHPNAKGDNLRARFNALSSQS